MVYAKTSKQKRWIKDIISLTCVIFASMLMAANINSFVHAGNLFPGGFTGLTVLIQRTAKEYFNIALPYTIINVTLNAIPAVISYKTIGKHFTFFSLLMVFLTGIFADLFPYFTITQDRLLVSVFGGLINGTAISIALHGRASSGGTDFIAVFLSNKFNASSWNTVLILNACMLSVAGLLFGWEAALYSIIFQYVSTQMINTLHQTYSKATLNIITSNPEAIEKPLLAYTHHGMTRFEGVGSYTNQPKTMLYTTINRDEVKEVIEYIHTLEPKAFITVSRSESVYGNYFKEKLD